MSVCLSLNLFVSVAVPVCLVGWLVVCPFFRALVSVCQLLSGQCVYACVCVCMSESVPLSVFLIVCLIDIFYVYLSVTLSIYLSPPPLSLSLSLALSPSLCLLVRLIICLAVRKFCLSVLSCHVLSYLSLSLSLFLSLSVCLLYIYIYIYIYSLSLSLSLSRSLALSLSRSLALSLSRSLLSLSRSCFCSSGLRLVSVDICQFVFAYFVNVFQADCLPSRRTGLSVLNQLHKHRQN